jgi:hypothetical protein
LKWAFYVDFDKVKVHINFKEKLEQKFDFFFQITDSFKDINSFEKQHEGKFYMDLPSWLGSTQVCFLDLTYAKPILDWGKIFLRCVLWIGFAKFILYKLDINLHVG